jgi:hypothetical protein
VITTQICRKARLQDDATAKGLLMAVDAITAKKVTGISFLPAGMDVKVQRKIELFNNTLKLNNFENCKILDYKYFLIFGRMYM